MTTKSTTKRNPAVSDENTKWFQRGFDSKVHYQGWLQFNDLIDEGYGFDDVYHDDYSGKTVRLSATDQVVADLENQTTKFLALHAQQK